MSYKEFLEYLGYLLWVLLFVFVVYLISDGPSKIAYEAGRVFSSFQAGFVAGSAQGASNLNNVFPEKKK